MYEFIRHTVRKGSIVIYPRWQTDIAIPCPGPFDIEPCMTSAVNGIRGALAYLRARPKRRVQPQLRTDELLRLLLRRHHHREPREPLQVAAPAEAAGDLPRRPARRRPRPGSTSRRWTTRWRASRRRVKLQCHSGADGRHRRAEQGERRAATRSSRSSAHIPKRNKDLVLTHTDTHGDPDAVLRARRVRRRRRARPTPTTGTSAGRSGTRCAAAPTTGPTAATRSATRRSIAPTAGGATACRSRR